MESDEIDQIAYRMAIKLGHTRVYGVDATGQFPFDKLSEFAKKHGSFRIIEDSIKEGQAIIEEENRLLAESTLTQYFRNMNDWKLMEEEFGFYMRLLHINHDEDYPGAGLVADWHERNLKILANIMRISEKGDRVFVLIGAGHAYLLRQYIAVTPGLKLVDPLDYL